MSDLALGRDTTGLVVVDFQERLAAAMPPADLARALKNTCILIEAARELGLPVVVTEQYPKGLGPTVIEVRDVLARIDPPPTVHAKVEFNACRAGSVRDAIERAGRRAWIVCGMEAHVCVYQTARELVRSGYSVHVPADAVVSRTAENAAIGRSLVERAGAVVTSTETVVFDLLGSADAPAFKAISKLVR